MPSGSHCDGTERCGPLASRDGLRGTRATEADEQTGIDILRGACEESLRQISGNAGYEGAIVCERVRDNENANCGFNPQSVD
jgi:chaperonin GroEL (HSP60 family)